MLDYELSISVSDQAWGSATATATAQATAQAPLDHENVEMVRPASVAQYNNDSRRRYRRVRVTGRALAIRGDDRYGVITIDISPIGIGFLSPVQLLPKEKILLCFEPAEQLVLEIRRCIRTEGTTYSCGGNFAQGPLSPAAYRNFLAELRS